MKIYTISIRDHYPKVGSIWEWSNGIDVECFLVVETFIYIHESGLPRHRAFFLKRQHISDNLYRKKGAWTLISNP